MTPAQAAIALHLRRHPLLTTADLSQALGYSEGTINRALRDMEDQGQVFRIQLIRAIQRGWVKGLSEEKAAGCPRDLWAVNTRIFLGRNVA